MVYHEENLTQRLGWAEASRGQTAPAAVSQKTVATYVFTRSVFFQQAGQHPRFQGESAVDDDRGAGLDAMEYLDMLSGSPAYGDIAANEGVAG